MIFNAVFWFGVHQEIDLLKVSILELC